MGFPAEANHHNDRGLRQEPKKSLTPALFTLADGGVVQDPEINQILFARKINHYLGVQIWPWEVDEFPEDFAIVLDALMNGLPKFQKHMVEVESYFEKWRNSHPNYKK